MEQSDVLSIRYLDDDFEYNSQWVFDNMHGKWNYINYLRGKFNSILKTFHQFQEPK